MKTCSAPWSFRNHCNPGALAAGLRRPAAGPVAGPPFPRSLIALLLLCLACLAAMAQKQTPPATDRGQLLRGRREWFYRQRAFPRERIPSRARLDALEQMNRMLAAEAAAAPTTQWTSIGPQPIRTPFSYPTAAGRVTAQAVDPRNSSVVYLGAAQGGVWKTADGGSTWTVLTDTQPSLAVGALALDPSNPDIVYVGTGEENFSYDSYYGVGILKSTNAGSTWTNLVGPFGGPVQAYLGGASIGALAVHPTNGSIVLAAVSIYYSGSTAGIYRSTDGGSSWTTVLTGSSGTQVFFDPTNGNIAYAALGAPGNYASNGVYKSADAGVTWTRINGSGLNVLPTTNVGRIAMTIAPSSLDGLRGNPQHSKRRVAGVLQDGGWWLELDAARQHPGLLHASVLV